MSKFSASLDILWLYDHRFNAFKKENVSQKYWNQILFLENDITHILQMYTEMRMRWTTKFESQNDCKSISLAVWYWMLWIRSIHSSQHTTHMGNFSKLWSPLSKESPHQILEGGRGRLTGTGDEKGLLQLLYMGLTNIYRSKWEQQTEKENAFLEHCFWITV